MVELKKFTFLSLLTFIITSFACNKTSQDCPTEFIIPASIQPYQETYQLGDTITLTSKFSKNVYERTQGKRYNMEGIQWQPGIVIYDLLKDSMIVSKTNQYINPIISSSDSISWFYGSGNYVSLELNYNNRNDSFFLEQKVILDRQGIFMLAFGSALFDSDIDFPGKCKKYSFYVYTEMNKGKDGNTHLLSESPNSYYNDYMLKNLDKKFYDGGSMCYRVVE